MDRYINDISEQMANKITGGNKELLETYEKAMMKQMVEVLQNQLANDQVLQAYGNKIAGEVNKTIDTVAEKTAKELAKNYTKTIANEIANNLIQKQLSGEAVEGVIREELSKYETVIYQELEKVDTKVAELKKALTQVKTRFRRISKRNESISKRRNRTNLQFGKWNSKKYGNKSKKVRRAFFGI